MSLGTKWKREVRVATSLKAQPIWFRVLKWIAIIVFVFYFWASPHFWLYLAAALVFSLTLHFVWRWKTKGWTQPWGGWNDVDSANREKR